MTHVGWTASDVVGCAGSVRVGIVDAGSLDEAAIKYAKMYWPKQTELYCCVASADGATCGRYVVRSITRWTAERAE